MFDQPSLPVRARTSRRSRPSLAAFTDSGYEPSRPATLKKASLPRSFSRSANVSEEPSVRGISSKLLGELFKEPFSYRASKSQTVNIKRSPFSFAIDGEAAASTATITANTPSKSESSVYPRTATISRSATISSAWSGVSNRLFMESILGTGNERQANEFTDQFDQLAKKHGIQPFPHDYKAEPTSVSVSSASQNPSSGESTPTLGGNKFWNKLLGRTPSTIDVSKQHGNIKMTLTKKRNTSVSDLAAIGKGKRDSLKGMHLEDMIRLGGVAIFNLPLGLAPGDLLIPTCMHAAAMFLLNNGLKTPGIFRVSGNLTTVYSLYDHYQKQLEENNNEAVVATTALARLPSHIHYSIHDVAHLFRKLLHGLPGGLLGSPAVFQALYNIHRFVYPDPSLSEHMTKKVKPRMIALAISSVNLHFRISLICAVFGLLRAISLASEQEVEVRVKDPHEMFAQMKEDALGIVFGPLLLGDKSDHILTEDLEDRGGLLVLASVDPAAKMTTRRGKGKKMDLGHSKKQLEKTRRAAMVCQMLIDNWEDICYQMKRINTLGATAQAYDLPAQVKTEFRYASEEAKQGTVRDESRQTIKSQRGTQRSRRSNGTQRSNHVPVVDEEEDHHHHHHHHHIHGHRIPLPQLHGHHFHKPLVDLPDLMRFSTRGSRDEVIEEPFPVPLVPERIEMTPIAEMTPAHSLKSPSINEPESSPNWRIIAPEMEEPITPLRRYDIQYREPSLDERSISSGSQEGFDPVATPPLDVTPRAAIKPRGFEPADTPPLEITPRAAIRPRRGPIILAPPFEEARMDEDFSSLSAPTEMESADLRSTFGRRPISPIPEPLPNRDASTDPEDDQRPITPRPLSFRKKSRGSSFSIYEDDEAERTPRAGPSRLQSSPVLTLTKPNSRGEIRLNPKGNMSSPTKSPPESPMRPQSVPLQPATPNRRPRASLDSDFEDRFLFEGETADTPSPKKLRGNSALYAEIRRLQRLVDQKNEEATSTRRELELAKSMANAGTLSQLVRETQEELKVWKNRAEWAEKQLKERGIVRTGSRPGGGRGHAHRYSMS